MSRSAKEQNILLASLSQKDLEPNPFVIFDDWLDAIESDIQKQDKQTILLTLDEFEELEKCFSAGHLDPNAILGMLRHMVQHRRSFKLLLAGSHTLNEFKHFATHLNNTQTVHLGYLSENEAIQLIQTPVRDFPLIYSIEACRHVLWITNCHPYLIQLLCSEIIDLKNSQATSTRTQVTIHDIENAIPQVLSVGSPFFIDIETSQIATTHIDILRWVARQGPHVNIEFSEFVRRWNDTEGLRQILKHSVTGGILLQEAGAYKFQVEAIRRWFAGQFTVTDIARP